jgi:pimeloyl-ACP methyl ester carboxylesterase
MSISTQIRQRCTVVWDKRGTGLSDEVTDIPTLDERMDDLRAVLDAVEMESPALVGMSEGGPMSILFAATNPERVRLLVLYGTAARFSPELPAFPWGVSPEQADEVRKDIENNWGAGAFAEMFFGPIADVPGVRDMLGKEQRASASPMMVRLLWEAVLQIDVREVLGSVHTPRLVLSRRGDRVAVGADSSTTTTAGRHRASTARQPSCQTHRRRKRP